MSSNGPNDTREAHDSQQEHAQGEQAAEARHSGEGAASAMAHMISQGQQHRRQSGEADDAAGGHP